MNFSDGSVAKLLTIQKPKFVNQNKVEFVKSNNNLNYMNIVQYIIKRLCRTTRAKWDEGLAWKGAWRGISVPSEIKSGV